MTTPARVAWPLTVGAVAWLVLVVAPQSVRGQPLFGWTLVLLGAVLGATVRGPAVFSALLGLPALLTAPWLAPRGDDDGLWVLIFPAIVFWSACAVGTHAAAAAIMRRQPPTSEKPPDSRT